MLKWFKALPELLEFESGVYRTTYAPFILKIMLEYSDGDNYGETKQLKQKLPEHYNNHIFLSMLKGMRTLFASEMWLSTSSMKK